MAPAALDPDRPADAGDVLGEDRGHVDLVGVEDPLHLGAAYGVYMGVDLALVLAVLPHPEDNAKDLGVFNIANAGPQSLAPPCSPSAAARTTTCCT